MRTSKRPVFRPTLRILCGIGIVFCCLTWIEYRLAAQAQRAQAAEAALGLPFQGRLLTPSGMPVTSGKWTALFSIYTTETGATSEWSSGDILVDVKPGGFFATHLGAPARPFVGIDFSEQLYVGVRIDNPGDGVTTANEPEMLPRIPLVPALYAHEAGFSHQAGDSQLLNSKASEFFGTAEAQNVLGLKLDDHESRINTLLISLRTAQQGISALKQNQYNINVSGDQWTTTRAVGVPYQTTDGTWRIKLNILGSQDNNNSTTTVNVEGISSTAIQSLSYADGSIAWGVALIGSGTGTIRMHAANPTKVRAVSGDIELLQKPNFVND